MILVILFQYSICISIFYIFVSHLSRPPTNPYPTIVENYSIRWEIFNIRIIKLHASNNRFFIEQRAKRGHGLPCNRFRSRIFERKKMPAVISAFPFPLPLERKLAVEGALRKARALYWNWTHPDNPNLRSPPSFSSSLQRSLSLFLSSLSFPLFLFGHWIYGVRKSISSRWSPGIKTGGCPARKISGRDALFQTSPRNFIWPWVTRSMKYTFLRLVIFLSILLSLPID